MELISELVFWHWLILAGILLVLEMTLPVTFFLWLAVAACCMAVITFLFSSIGVPTQLVLFSVLCILSLIAWKRWRIGMKDKPNHPTLNQRGRIYINRVFTLPEPIVNGSGKIIVDDTTWKVAGPDLAAGQTVKVTATKGAVLVVEAV